MYQVKQISFQTRWNWLASTITIRDFSTEVNLYLPALTWQTHSSSSLKCCCVSISVPFRPYFFFFRVIINLLPDFVALLKEVHESPLEMVKSQKYDAERMALYPNLDYKQLYNALTQLIDVVSSIHIGLQGSFYIFLFRHLHRAKFPSKTVVI